jgi:hypothetical protein
MPSKIKEITVGATIATAQYSNLQPTITIEVGDSLEEANALAMQYITKLSHEYSEPGKKLPGASTSGSKELTDFFGNKILYDEVNHIYSWKGEIYESGSQYAAKFDKPFDGATIAKKMATKYGVGAEDIQQMWELKARTSREFGTALHSALELYGRYNDLATALERETHLHDHPVIKSAVESFYKGRESEEALYEVLVVDHKNKRAGRIDRLLVEGENDYTVQDYKTGAEMKPDKLKVYFKQLDFYGEIIRANGSNTNPPQIFHYDGSWHEFNQKERVTS